jgi:4-hydroxy-3-methylbut-2-enyl diphosphate reductase IspH
MNNPFFETFQAVHDCLLSSDASQIVDCVHSAIKGSEEPTAAQICNLTNTTASGLVGTSPTVETCAIVTDKGQKSSTRKLLAECARLQQPLTAVEDVIRQCKYGNSSSSTQWGVVLGIAIPIGLIGLVVMLSCLYAVVRLMQITKKQA